jgi:hypothetical protein
MKRQVRFILSILLIGGLASCSLSGAADPDEYVQEVAVQYETVSAMLTATAARSPEAAPSRVVPPTSTQVRTATPTILASTPTLDSEPVEMTRAASAALLTQAVNVPCDLAQAGRPIDITIPDDSRLRPGAYFSKTWRLVNVGRCTWQADYALVWFSGHDLGLVHAQPLNVTVEPGQSVDLTMDMLAPIAPGAYQSNWKLRNQDGGLFGIGPNGDAPFWARIVVVPDDTPTPTLIVPTITFTPTPTEIFQGSLELRLDESVELDSEAILVQDDLLLQRDADARLVLAPAGGAQLASFGLEPPLFNACQAVTFNEAPLELEAYQPNTWFCYYTSEGALGRMQIVSLDLQEEIIRLEFATWSAP